MSASTTALQQIQNIFSDEGNFNGNELTQKAKKELSSIDCSNISYQDLLELKKIEKLPLEFKNSVFKGFMRRQDDLLSNLSGNFLYTQTTEKDTLSHFFGMLTCPNLQNKSELVIKNILRHIASGGAAQDHSEAPLNPLIDPKNLDDGVIRFYSSYSVKDHPASCLFDFSRKTYYQNTDLKDRFFVIGFPPFMKVKLTSYTLYGPPEIPNRTAQGGPKNWEIYASNDWDDIIKNGSSSVSIHRVPKDMNLQGPNKSFEYCLNLNDDQYYRYFKFVAISEQHSGDSFIYLSGIDFSGNIQITCDE